MRVVPESITQTMCDTRLTDVKGVIFVQPLTLNYVTCVSWQVFKEVQKQKAEQRLKMKPSLTSAETAKTKAVDTQ